MSLIAQLLTDRKDAKLSGNKQHAQYLTTLVGEIQTIEKREGVELTEQMIVKLIKDTVKALNENALRVEDPEVFLAEVEFWNKYLPTQLTHSGLTAIIETFIEEHGVPKNPGPVMAFLNKNYSGQFDGKVAGGIVKDILNG